MDDDQRRVIAARIQVAKDAKLPSLMYWNQEPCSQHKAWVDEDGLYGPPDEIVEGYPFPACRQCGAIFRRHQRVAVAWLYAIGKGLLADPMGSGKTITAAGLMALLKEREELHSNARAVVVMRSPALLQWQEELHRLVPGLNVMVAGGSRDHRVNRYLQEWEVCLIGYQMLQRDYETLAHFPIDLVFGDDLDVLRHRTNRSAYCFKRLASQAERVVLMTGTPVHKRLHEMHSVLEPIGGRVIFGNESDFIRRYVRTETQEIRTRYKKRIFTSKVIGYKNLDEFNRLISPIVLRRSVADLDDVSLPSIIASDVMLELYPAQRVKYNELRSDVKGLLRVNGGKSVKQMSAMAKIHAGARICAGLAAMGEPDGPNTAVKMDWVLEQLDGGLEGKVVMFVNYKTTIKAFHERFLKAGIGHEIIWADEPDPVVRKRRQERFWIDDNCRVLMGTTSIEQSLNLQCARHLINVDTILNPARMAQLAGRIRRDGSAFKHVYVHNLRCLDTQEERYAGLLNREQALLDYIWKENSELFESISPWALLQLIAG
jgi:SNF2 family DNA or RNA helicase